MTEGCLLSSVESRTIGYIQCGSRGASFGSRCASGCRLRVHSPPRSADTGPMRRYLIALVLLLAACSDDGETTEAPVTEPTEQADEPVDETDPYEVYLANNPDPDLILSREDAQTRALLGCGTNWAPGTIDRVLQDAYDLC